MGTRCDLRCLGLPCAAVGEVSVWPLCGTSSRAMLRVALSLGTLAIGYLLEKVQNGVFLNPERVERQGHENLMESKKQPWGSRGIGVSPEISANISDKGLPAQKRTWTGSQS